MNVSVSMSTSSNGSNALSCPPTTKAAGITTTSTFVLAVAFAGVLSSNCFAQARNSVQEIDEIKGQAGWNLLTTDKGCIAYLSGAFFNDQKSITWTASCQSGQPISGKGVLALNFPENKKVSWSGQFVNGFLHGRAKMHSDFNGDSVDVYEMGCVANWGAGCPSRRPSQTKSAENRSERSQYFEIENGKSKIVPTTPPKVSMAAGQAPYGKVGEGGPTDPTPAPAPRQGNGSPGLGVGIIGVPLPKLSSAQVAACSDEIRRTQLTSQGWAGDANAVAARLGRIQKDLFEGRCAGHPEAATYIAGADRMLSYTQAGGSGTNADSGTAVAGTAGLSGGSSSGASRTLPPSAHGGNSKQHDPAHNATECIKIYGTDEAKALGIHGVLPSTMVNACPYSVSVTWCVAAGQRGPGDCRPGYSNLVNLSGAGEKGSNRYGVDASNQTVNYAACRYGKNMGFQQVELDPRNPFQFSCR